MCQSLPDHNPSKPARPRCGLAGRERDHLQAYKKYVVFFSSFQGNIMRGSVYTPQQTRNRHIYTYENEPPSLALPIFRPSIPRISLPQTIPLSAVSKKRDRKLSEGDGCNAVSSGWALKCCSPDGSAQRPQPKAKMVLEILTGSNSLVII